MTTRRFDYLRDPAAIYAESFAAIRRETDLSRIPDDLQPLALRIVHSCGDPAIHVRDTSSRILVGDDLCAGRSDHALVAAGMIAVLVGIQDLCDSPASLRRNREALVEVQRVYGECVAGLRAGDQVVEITVGIPGPDLFDDHDLLHGCGIINEFTADPGLQYANIIDLGCGNVEVVPVDNDEVCPFAWIEAA